MELKNFLFQGTYLYVLLNNQICHWNLTQIIILLLQENEKNVKEIVEQARWDSNMKKLTARANFLAENRKKNQWTYGLETYGTSF